MKKALSLSFVFAVLASPIAGRSDEEQGPLLVRIRGIFMLPANGSDAATGIPEDAIHVSKKLFPEVDVSFYFLEHFAAELILSYPQNHDVTVSGTDSGSFSHLPPTLTLQYHFLPDGVVRPYIGVGMNLTFIFSVDLANGLDLSSPSVGLAAQVGADFNIAPHWFLNADVKFVTIRTNVMSGSTNVTSVRVDPFLLAAGVGYRF